MRTSTLAFMLSIALAGCGMPDDGSDDFSSLDGLDEKSDAFSSKMKILGSLDYGQSSETLKYHNPPRFRAYKFAGDEGDKVSATVASADGAPIAWILDNSFKVLGRADDDGSGVVTVSVTLKASKSRTHYVVYREAHTHNASFSVELQGTPAQDFYSCHRDSDCVKVSQGGCCPNGWMVAVNTSSVDAYARATACQNPGQICPLYVINDTRVAECNTGTQKCEMVKPEDIRCGGFTTNPHSCPKGYSCQSSSIPDVPGQCVANATDECGGCASGQYCSYCWGHWACIPNGALC
jgi:hypothetical protein